MRELRESLGRSPRPVAGVPAGLSRQVLRFGAIGALSTISYLLLFMLARPMGAQMANLIALLLTAVANTAANRRFTFGIRGPGTARHQLHGLLVFGLGLLLTSGSLLAACAGRRQPAASRRADRARRRQPGRDRPALRTAPRVGVLPSPRRAANTRPAPADSRGALVTTTYDPSPSGSALDGPPTEPVDRRDAAVAERRGVRWQRISLVALLAGTALLYLVGLSESDWANQYYAAAAQAGAQSWKAMLFGSLDSANFITVDKPPASLWVMDLAMRFFGVNSWSLLVPQALEGVAAVALLYAAVKRVGGHPAGLLAGAALAVTPVATLMFRFDNPDAMLVLLMTAAAYATVRAVERASWRWLSLVRSAARLRVPDQDAAGPDRGPCVRARLPRGRARSARPADPAHPRRRRSPGGGRRLVGGARRAVAGGLPPVHRRLEAQLHPRVDVRLQRLRPAYRQRQQRHARRKWRWRVLLRPDRADPAVRHRDGHPDLLAAARRRSSRSWPWRG